MFRPFNIVKWVQCLTNDLKSVGYYNEKNSLIPFLGKYTMMTGAQCSRCSDCASNSRSRGTVYEFKLLFDWKVV